MNKNLKLDIPDEDIQALMLKYVEDTLSEPSSELFQDKLAEGKNVFEAAGMALFNEAMSDVIKEGIEKSEKAELKKKQDNCNHQWESNGHGHNYSCWLCRKCGAEEDR